jgi:hypothetical protein
MMDDFSWECPKCGELIEGVGMASLNFLKHNHEYWEHARPEREAEASKNHGLPRYDAMPGTLVDGIAALDDAFYDGARLSLIDHGFLRTMKVCWNPPTRKQLES